MEVSEAGGGTVIRDELRKTSLNEPLLVRVPPEREAHVQKCIERTRAAFFLTEADRDAALRIDGGRHLADAADQGLAIERLDTVHMAHAIEQGHHHCLRAHGRRHVLQGLFQAKGLHRDDNGIISAIDGLRRDEFGLQRHIAMRAEQGEALLAQLGSAARAHQKGDVAPRLGQPAAKITTGGAGPHDENTHVITLLHLWRAGLYLGQDG
jgi:hypothetical protein